jgi:hypothetical protein
VTHSGTSAPLEGRERQLHSDSAVT